jgi:hypothetical protein
MQKKKGERTSCGTAERLKPGMPSGMALEVK